MDGESSYIGRDGVGNPSGFARYYPPARSGEEPESYPARCYYCKDVLNDTRERQTHMRDRHPAQIMVAYDERTVNVERHEFFIKAYGDPRGVPWGDVMDAIRGAHVGLTAEGLVEPGKDAASTAIRITGDDDGVTVSYTLERSGDSVRVR